MDDMWTVEYDVYHDMMCCSILLGYWKVCGNVVIFGKEILMCVMMTLI
jgi:hypothetical protein